MPSSPPFECVINVSEGRDRAVLDALAEVAGPPLVDLHRDVDHHRSVFTLAGDLGVVERAARRLAAAAVERLDIARHVGVHPRLGVVDVVPFVALDPKRRKDTIEAARRFAVRLAVDLDVPVFLYGDVSPERRTLPDVRLRAFADLRPDMGPEQPHPTAGATAVGVRDVLVAVNCDLDVDNVPLAKEIARTVRERDGGLPGVRALGLPLPTAGRAQVSMNLVDLARTGLEAACTAVRQAAEARGARVARVELVGLVPAAELARCSAQFRSWAELGADQTIESRLSRREGRQPRN
ncbi:MAG TPA: glutamate formiminotransferase [Acidimicrobiia bacterium]|nr:glutamate formiminotransferase [Acidimicrobiia bacterium]